MTPRSVRMATSVFLLASLVSLALLPLSRTNMTLGVHSVYASQARVQQEDAAPVSFFHLPDALGGKLAPNFREGTGCAAPCPPLAQFSRGTPTTYSYQVAPHVPPGGLIMGLYTVSIYATDADARRANVANRDGANRFDLAGSLAPLLTLANPVADTEWIRAHVSGLFVQWNARGCYAVGGVRYHNITVFAQVDNFGYRAAGPKSPSACAPTTAWVAQVLSALYGRAIVYKRVYGGPAPLTPTDKVRLWLLGFRDRFSSCTAALAGLQILVQGLTDGVTPSPAAGQAASRANSACRAVINQGMPIVDISPTHPTAQQAKHFGAVLGAVIRVAALGGGAAQEIQAYADGDTANQVYPLSTAVAAVSQAMTDAAPAEADLQQLIASYR